MAYQQTSAIHRLSERSLKHLGVKITTTLPLSAATTRVKSATISALRRGYLPSSTGWAAFYYELLCDEHLLPMLTFSKTSSWTGLNYKRIPERAHAAMDEWWHADRAAARLDGKLQPGSYETTKPDWSTDRQYCRIISERSVDDFEPAAQLIRETPDYQRKVAAAIEAMQLGHTFTFHVNH
jgi:hypothetical protein